MAARRFGVRQNDKLRPIDNFSEFHVNQAFGAEERVGMWGIDEVVSWSRAWMKAVSDEGRVCITDVDGQQWKGQIHHSWKVSDWRKVCGRVADLKSAYKQLPIHPAHAFLSIIAVRDPSSQQTKFFRAYALMFGETAAVYAFLRISRALSMLGKVLFDLVLVEFFDDFTQLECEELTQSAQDAMEGCAPNIKGEVHFRND